MKYEVQHYTLCDGWVNTWLETTDDGKEVPCVYATREEAQAELDEYLEDVADQIACGERDKNCGYDPSEYRIVEKE